jgi:hypothetical protein
LLDQNWILGVLALLLYLGCHLSLGPFRLLFSYFHVHFLLQILDFLVIFVRKLLGQVIFAVLKFFCKLQDIGLLSGLEVNMVLLLGLRKFIFCFSMYLVLESMLDVYLLLHLA